MSAARKHVKTKEARTTQEYQMMLHDRQIHPGPLVDANGHPRWQGSQAQLSLLDDIKKKKHLSMTKEQLYLSRPEYHNNYPNIYKKVDQLIKTEKFLKCWGGGRNGEEEGGDGS